MNSIDKKKMPSIYTQYQLIAFRESGEWDVVGCYCFYDMARRDMESHIEDEKRYGNGDITYRVMKQSSKYVI
jgi:hypothetical protein